MGAGKVSYPWVRVWVELCSHQLYGYGYGIALPRPYPTHFHPMMGATSTTIAHSLNCPSCAWVSTSLTIVDLVQPALWLHKVVNGVQLVVHLHKVVNQAQPPPDAHDWQLATRLHTVCK
jgi:hypothetical protein